MSHTTDITLPYLYIIPFSGKVQAELMLLFFFPLSFLLYFPPHTQLGPSYFPSLYAFVASDISFSSVISL
jgi:hypothetical protein